MLNTCRRIASPGHAWSFACGMFAAVFAASSFAHNEGVAANNFVGQTWFPCATVDTASSGLIKREYQDTAAGREYSLRNNSPYQSVTVRCFPRLHRITNTVDGGLPRVEGAIVGTVGFVSDPFIATFRFRNWASGALLLERTLTLNGAAYEEVSGAFGLEELSYFGSYSSIEITIPPEGVVNKINLTYR